ncbi:unnamed protein product [Aspergillus oryzae var. brunneus]|nr:unnamed protein product [Aspergillus oryzae]GMG35202.1 unnamed protein product [Aspergillus oryzae]GMG43855.1 unnamed protein product [Aspergillus oryzae var. brunneus]
MADGGYLVPPSQDADKEQIWTETRKRLERFLPDLFKEIFPEMPPAQSTLTPTAPSPDLPMDDTPADEQPKEDQRSSDITEGGDGNDEQKDE